MKSNIYIFFIAGILMLSCDDILVEDPKGALTESEFFTSQEELDMSITALFGMVRETQHTTNMSLPSFMQGDDVTTNPGSNKQAAAELDAFKQTDNNIGIADCWSSHYAAIKAANYVILNAGRTPTSEDEIKIAIGQAKYWRAYCYFTLVRVFGPIPLNLNNTIEVEMMPSSVEEVYAQIVKDLQDCESLLPADYTDAPRKMNGVNVYITQQAAKSTLAAVYMAMAGWPLNRKEYYAEAARKAKEVIDGVKNGIYEYILEDSFMNVYSPSHNYSNETVVGINFSFEVNDNQHSMFTLTQAFESLGGWGDFWGEIKFWKNMPEGPRKNTIYTPKILLENKIGGKLVDWWEKDENGINYVVENHPQFCVTTVGENDSDYDYTKPFSSVAYNSHRHRIIRYSEVLLWYAEAQARADGMPNDLAYECINRVRGRARGCASDLQRGLNGIQFADSALMEHGWEVAGYCNALVTRRADMMRMELLEKAFEERVKNEPIEIEPGVWVQESIPVTGVWNENLIYSPYPQKDASLNPNLKR